ncbi:N-acetylglucosamine-6-phosphate deacetylase [Aquibium sp. A9E412]|uniref:N-acetylglucosamine-6-phosphate deacetylase n=1 Tax=Aquibium sp. A9E412 TaxID=2976767 RepID=UPI0025B24FAF|nr:N-acetylglucosamine-6-phosphate deacetylase [Aquibium sp. A9E412]MDN2566619.1 N-acetylglucosamine-6-phosphate deacetylase [Aquibium sp. A9E412]
MTADLALTGARIFDGADWHVGHTLLVAGGRIAALVPDGAVDAATPRSRLDGGLLVPGFVDLQVNGGGGVQFNQEPTGETLATICRAHARLGTTALLATLITDTPAVGQAALAAGRAAAAAGLPGFLGLHLEGPHLAVARKGAHDAALIRPLAAADAEALAAARRGLPALLVTVAPEAAPAALIARLAKAGVTVSLGHSDADYAAAEAAIAAGATMVTHLFNAMSPLGHRAPGMVGAALESGAVSAGLIADGIHVDRHAIAIAVRAKRGPGRLFLVSDAMATLGTDLAGFTLNGRAVRRAGGRLTLADGTLAGADLDLLSAVRFMHREVGLALDEALRMAALYPAQAIGLAPRLGRLAPGSAASMVHLSDDLALRAAWVAGRPVD